jgi:twitching motility protein PilT
MHKIRPLSPTTRLSGRFSEFFVMVFSICGVSIALPGAAGTITRLIDVFPVCQQEQIRIQLSSNLIAVLSQALCPLAAGRRRVAAYEFMVVTPAIANLIRENKTYRIDSSIQTGKKLGMQLLDEHLWRLYDTGTITLEEMLDKPRQPGALQDKATAKIEAMIGKQKHKKVEAQKQMEDLGQILRS